MAVLRGPVKRGRTIRRPRGHVGAAVEECVHDEHLPSRCGEVKRGIEAPCLILAVHNICRHMYRQSATTAPVYVVVTAEGAELLRLRLVRVRGEPNLRFGPGRWAGNSQFAEEFAWCEPLAGVQPSLQNTAFYAAGAACCSGRIRTHHSPGRRMSLASFKTRVGASSTGEKREGQSRTRADAPRLLGYSK